MNDQILDQNGPKLIIALDGLSEAEAKAKILQISVECAWFMDSILFKVNDLLADIWLKWIAEMFEWVGWGLMLDPKWHDIPNTDENYFKKLWKYDLWNRADFVTMHASNWYEALRKAVETRNELWIRTKIFAVTALTSLDDEKTNRIFDENSRHTVLKLAKLALEAWVDGIVCSPMEAQLLRDVFGEKYTFEIITPWVRFEWTDVQDQKRVMTPKRAIEQWSSNIVMWRPILDSEDVGATVTRFFDEIKWVWYATDEQRNEFERLLYTGNWQELLRYIWAFYNRPEWGMYVRLASWLLSNGYINIWATERNYLVVERAANDMATEIKNKWLNANVVIWAQMWSVRLSLTLAEKLWIQESIYTEKWWEDGKDMVLSRHDIDLTGKKVILSEDIVTKWSTLYKMIELVKQKWWEVIAVTCVWNRYWEDSFEWIPLISCYTPEPFELYWDEKNPEWARWSYPELPEWVKISEKPKKDWDELVASMKGGN